MVSHVYVLVWTMRTMLVRARWRRVCAAAHVLCSTAAAAACREQCCLLSTSRSLSCQGQGGLAALLQQRWDADTTGSLVLRLRYLVHGPDMGSCSLQRPAAACSVKRP